MTTALRQSPYSSFGLMAITLTLGLASVFFFKLKTDWILSILLAINCTAFAMHGFDKSAAQNNKLRVPERIFWFLVLFGGAVGTLLGMKFFRHKTRKASYQFMVLVMILIHLAIVHYGFGYSISPQLRKQTTMGYESH
jgi:uncharacterized membrane protein YsdA (DUF1294 family)